VTTCRFFFFFSFYNKVPISEVLKAKHSYRWVEPVISHTATIQEAITAVIDGGLSGMMVLESTATISSGKNDGATVKSSSGSDATNSNKVVGLLTSRDLLRIMAKGIKAGESAEGILRHNVGDFMTPISQVIFGRPDETVGIARTLMAKLGIKCLPIISRDGSVEGLLTARDMSDFGLSAKDKGGKSSYLNDVSERIGLSRHTSMAEPPIYLKAHLALQQSHSPLFVNIGVSALPHPFKTHDGCGRRQRGTHKAFYSAHISTLSAFTHSLYSFLFLDTIS
jgi:CBS domain-containing protein